MYQTVGRDSLNTSVFKKVQISVSENHIHEDFILFWHARVLLIYVTFQNKPHGFVAESKTWKLNILSYIVSVYVMEKAMQTAEVVYVFTDDSSWLAVFIFTSYGQLHVRKPEDIYHSFILGCNKQGSVFSSFPPSGC